MCQPSPDKEAVFRESFRVLAPGGRLAISDIVLSRPLPDELGSLMALWTGCIAGALTEEQVVEGLQEAGFGTSVSSQSTSLPGLNSRALPLDSRPRTSPRRAGSGASDRRRGWCHSVCLHPRHQAGNPTKQRRPTRLPSTSTNPHCAATRAYADRRRPGPGRIHGGPWTTLPRGADIFRHNLANDPSAFAEDDAVRAFLQVAGSEGLPLTTVDGVTVMTGGYPTRAQLLKFADLADDAVPAGAALLTMADDSSAESSCGCGPSGCC